MRRVMVIVARDRPELYEYLKDGLAGISGIQVVLDRRVTVGRGAEGQPVDPERRHEIQVYDELVMRGFIIRPVS